MDRIYNDAKDKNVAKVIIYIGADPNSSEDDVAYTFFDSKLTKKMTTSELEDAFHKGCVCIFVFPYDIDLGYHIEFSPVSYFRMNNSGIGFITGVGLMPGESDVTGLTAQSIPDPT